MTMKSYLHRLKHPEARILPSGNQAGDKFTHILATLSYNPEKTWRRQRGYYASINRVKLETNVVDGIPYTSIVHIIDLTANGRGKSFYGCIKEVKRRSNKQDDEAILLFDAFYRDKMYEMYGDTYDTEPERE